MYPTNRKGKKITLKGMRIRLTLNFFLIILNTRKPWNDAFKALMEIIQHFESRLPYPLSYHGKYLSTCKDEENQPPIHIF